MKLRLGRKRSNDPLRPLTEREIQHRLYGAFREEASSAPEKRGAEFVDSRLGNQTLVLDWKEKRAVWKRTSDGLRNLLSQSVASSVAFIKNVVRQKGLAGLVAVSMAVLLFLAVHALNLYRTEAMKNPKKAAARAVPRAVASEEKPRPSEGRLTQSETSPTVPEPEEKLPPVRLMPPGPPVVEEKGYVVQVCTYAREEDAQRLVFQMNEAGLPAFQKPLRRPSGKTFYSVFLGRYKTYREAQGKLQEFRGSPMAHEFPDVFIRSL